MDRPGELRPPSGCEISPDMLDQSAADRLFVAPNGMFSIAKPSDVDITRGSAWTGAGTACGEGPLLFFWRGAAAAPTTPATCLDPRGGEDRKQEGQGKSGADGPLGDEDVELSWRHQDVENFVGGQVFQQAHLQVRREG